MGARRRTTQFQLDSRITWIGFSIHLDTDGVAPKLAKRQTAIGVTNQILQAEKVKMGEIASLRGLLACMANVCEAYRPFVQSLFVLGQADPARRHLLAWRSCPEQAAEDVKLWLALLTRDQQLLYLQPTRISCDTLTMVDACAGSESGPGCAWQSGCGIGGVGPRGQWFAEEIGDALFPWLATRQDGSNLAGPLEMLAALVALKLWGADLQRQGREDVVGIPLGSDNMSNVYMFSKLYTYAVPLSLFLREFAATCVKLRLLLRDVVREKMGASTSSPSHGRRSGREASHRNQGPQATRAAPPL